MPIRSQNPATEEILEEFDEASDSEIESALEKAAEAARRQSAMQVAERAQAMERAAELLEAEKDSYARTMTLEMGKPLAAAVSEVEKCAWACRYYAEHGQRFLEDEPVESDAARSFIRYLPIGPVLAVMPWNFPYWQVFRFAAPALVAGNVGLLKHASNVPRCALAIEDVLRRAGFEDGAFQALLIGSGKVEKVLRDSRVRAATLTGSEGAGRAVAKTAGSEIKKTVLELGGSDPFIVMPSAEMDKTVEAAVTARTINNGQSCIAAKRFLVHEDVYDDFSDAFVAGMGELSVGDPMADGTDIGPLAMKQIRDDLHQQVEETVEAGATRLSGARPVDGKGFFYQPGVLADIPADAPAFSEEVFGPVALLFRVKDLTQALELANATRFGLGSSIWTQDESEAERAAMSLDAGATFVNSIVASDPRLPFGGVKSSGYGRELSRLGMLEFVNQKTVSVA